jgi:hypothetical protein
MPNPAVNFRLSPYQLARGLQVIRQLEPDYKIISINQIVKIIYFDYIAKMNLNQNDDVPPELILEINTFMTSPKSTGVTLDELLKQEEEQKPAREANEEFNRNLEDQLSRIPEGIMAPEPKTVEEDEPTESIISSVSDFSPPDEWKND